MRAIPWSIRAMQLLGVLSALSCTDEIVGPGAAETITVVSGGTSESGRVILAHADRVDTVIVSVRDARNNPVPGVPLTWSSDDPDAVVTVLEAETDLDGLARAEWRLSGAPGTWKLRAASAPGMAAEASFTVTSWSVKRAVVVGVRTCAQSHQDQLWCRANDAAPFTLHLGGLPIQAIQGEGESGSPPRYCVLGATGSMYCTNVSGEFAFTPIAGQDRPFVAIAIGGGLDCGLDAEGLAWCRGRGWLGDGVHSNNRREALAPVVQPEGIRFTGLSVNAENGCAITGIGTAWCWGRGTYGVTGSPTGKDHGVPQEIALPAPLISISTPLHGGAACGVTTARLAVCWGNGGHYGGVETRGAPRVLDGIVDAIALAPMPSGFLALRAKGELTAWGVYYFGHSMPLVTGAPLGFGSAVRARSISAGTHLHGTTCIDDAAGRGTVCTHMRDLATPDVLAPLWIGLTPP